MKVPTKLLKQQKCWHLVVRRLSFAASRPAPAVEYNEHTNSRQIFDAAVNSVLPQNMVRSALSFEGRDNLMIDGRFYKLNNNVHVAAFGKAVAGMVRAAEDILGDNIVEGYASIPVGLQDVMRKNNKLDLLPNDNSRIKLIEGSPNNMPDDNAHHAAKSMADMAKKLGKHDILLTLISGGGSALLPSPIPPITLQDVGKATKVLQSHGATIQQLNLVRKHIEILKGGGLAKLALPAKVVSLVLSDVIGDPLDLIASGPTVRDYSTPKQCLDLFKSLGVTDKLPKNVLDVIEKKSKEPVTPPITHFSHATDLQQIYYGHNVIVGSNKIAVNTAAELATDLGYLPYVLSTRLDGDARETALMFTRIGQFVSCVLDGKAEPAELCQQELGLVKSGLQKEQVNDLRSLTTKAYNTASAICILAGGETTVNVTGTGRGGRNQEMALTVAVELHELSQSYDAIPKHRVTLLCGGTDGQDGPTPAAGAVADSKVVSAASAAGLDPQAYLDNNDAYTFFTQLENGHYLLNTGLTGTNVMDIQALLVHPAL